MKEISITSPAELPIVANQLLATMGHRKVLTFEGEIGAGKTTLIKEICRQLGVEEDVTSPTFSIVNEYVYQDDKGADRRIYHMDIYRLETIDEAMEIGIEEYLDSGEICLIEWPKLIKPLLLEDVLAIKVAVEDDFSRKLLFL